ncbi:hypothetical protein [Plantactinospora sp. BB1]|nr:hypothetical protein [Plantactinospora sp. BB1]
MTQDRTPYPRHRHAIGGDLFDTYADSFDRVEAAARPAWPAEVTA